LINGPAGPYHAAAKPKRWVDNGLGARKQYALFRALGMAQRAVASGNRIFQVLDRAPEIVSQPDARALPPGGGRVAFSGLLPPRFWRWERSLRL
jgi:hypothetical protein